MNAQYLYDMIAYHYEIGSIDLYITLAKYAVVKPMPEGMTRKNVHDFIADHWEKLLEVYKTGDAQRFAEVVAECEAEDAQRAARRP